MPTTKEKNNQSPQPTTVGVADEPADKTQTAPNSKLDGGASGVLCKCGDLEKEHVWNYGRTRTTSRCEKCSCKKFEPADSPPESKRDMAESLSAEVPSDDGYGSPALSSGVDVKDTLQAFRDNCYSDEMQTINSERLSELCFNFGKEEQRKQDIKEFEKLIDEFKEEQISQKTNDKYGDRFENSVKYFTDGLKQKLKQLGGDDEN